MADNTCKELRNKMIYQVFIRNYSEEGTFAAVERDLPRIRDLGCDIIYLLPIHPIGEKFRKGTLGSPYAIRDYRAVNPEYGTLEDFRHLVDTIHQMGMKCMIDVVYNHTSPDSVLSKEHPEWFYHKEDGSFGNRVGEWYDVIDLDYSNPGLWDYQIETLKYWAGFVDGFRCDVAPMVPIAFWERARREVEEIRKEFIWLSESINAAFLRELRSRSITAHSDCEIYRAFDISYDYDVYPQLTEYLTGKAPLKDWLDALSRQESIYPDNYVKAHFLENHDQARAHFLIPDEKALRNMTAFQFFQKGTAFVYAGQEYAVSHLPGLFDKDTVSMRPEGGIDLSGLIRILSDIRKDPVFTDSSFEVFSDDQEIITAFHIGRSGESGRMAAGIFSLKGKAGVVHVAMPDGIYINQIDGTPVEIFKGMLSCSGEPVIVVR